MTTYAVTSVGTDNYTYDANGNMLTRPGQTITWDAENCPVSITGAIGNSTFVYDGDGMRVKKTEGGEIILYINKYYEKNLTTGEETTYYYLGDRRVAMRKGTDLQYIHQDHLTARWSLPQTTAHRWGALNITHMDTVEIVRVI